MKSSVGGFIKITKMEAAERQLITATKLYFRQEDPFSVHTLVGAAVGILNDLARRNGISRPFEDTVALGIRSEKKREFLCLLRSGRNFLKHADKDPEAVFKMNPDVNKYDIVEGLMLLEALNESIPSELFFYRIWFNYHHEDLFEANHIPSFKKFLKTISGGRMNDRDMSDFTLITKILKSIRGQRVTLRKSTLP